MTAKQLFKQIEQDIIDNAPSLKIRQRLGLKRYLGKTKKFTGTYGLTNEDGSIMIRDIKLQGSNKTLAHHVWIPLNKNHTFGAWDKVEFEGTVITYNNRGVQKYKIATIGKVERG